MKLTSAFAFMGLLAPAKGIRIVHSNDDGWATKPVRMLFGSMNKTHDVVLSAPPDNKSGHGPKEATPGWRYKPCQFDTCRADSPPYGRDPDHPDLNWVNSYAVTAMQWGVETIGPRLWGGQEAELAISGINLGRNIMWTTHFSSTISAAAWAAKHGVPAIAFSGHNADWKAYWEDPTPASIVYNELAMVVIEELIKSGKPYLPDDTYLNVNFPRLRDECRRAEQFRFIITRVNEPFFKTDAEWCGATYLPCELSVLDSGAPFPMPCTVTISPGDAHSRDTQDDHAKQAIVMEKLKNLVECPAEEWYAHHRIFEPDAWADWIGDRRPASDPRYHEYNRRAHYAENW